MRNRSGHYQVCCDGFDRIYLNVIYQLLAILNIKDAVEVGRSLYSDVVVNSQLPGEILFFFFLKRQGLFHPA